MNFRTKPRIKATIQRAAALAGLDDSAFTMQAAYQAARAVIQPPPALKAAFQRHQRTVLSR